jgi:hypothetical protein
MTVSWGSSETSADYHPLHTFNFPTTYTDDWLVGKLVSASPPPIEKRGSWGSCLRLPHHLYRRVARGEVAESPLITPLPKLQLPHHYREEWSRGEVSVYFPTTYREERLVGKPANLPLVYAPLSVASRWHGVSPWRGRLCRRGCVQPPTRSPPALPTAFRARVMGRASA